MYRIFPYQPYLCFSHQDGCPEQPASACGNVAPVIWPETEIGNIATVTCPCGVDDQLIQLLQGTRRCGGTYDSGAVWQNPQCDSCSFSNTRLNLCKLAQVGCHYGTELIVISLPVLLQRKVAMIPCYYILYSSYAKFFSRLTAQPNLPTFLSTSLTPLRRFRVKMFL